MVRERRQQHGSMVCVHMSVGLPSSGAGRCQRVCLSSSSRSLSVRCHICRVPSLHVWLLLCVSCATHPLDNRAGADLILTYYSVEAAKWLAGEK